MGRRDWLKDPQRDSGRPSACAKAWVHAECGVFGKAYIRFSEVGRAMLRGWEDRR